MRDQIDNESTKSDAGNKTADLDCLRLISDGSGIGYLNGMATFVPGLLPGETAEVQVCEEKKRWQRARLHRLINLSPKRVPAPCSVFQTCGGCQLQHTTYEETLFWKQRWVEDALARIGKIKATVKPVIGMPDPWRYRNKVRLHRDASGKFGYYSLRSKELVHFQDCLLLSERMNRWIRLTEDFFKAGGLAGVQSVTFRENTRGEGILLLEKQSTVREQSTARENYPQHIKTLWDTLSAAGVRSICGTDAKDALKRMWEDSAFNQKIQGMTFEISPLSFLQVNSQQMETLNTLVSAEAALTGEELVWDLYSGIGVFSCVLSAKAGKIIGIEDNPFAVEDAHQNAAQNNLSGKVEFLQGKVEVHIKHLTEGPDVVVLDPPRSGVHAKVIQRLLELKPLRIVYVSCDPGTLARDVGMLTEGAYRIDSVQPLDMFPWTSHVECVVLMSLMGC